MNVVTFYRWLLAMPIGIAFIFFPLMWASNRVDDVTQAFIAVLELCAVPYGLMLLFYSHTLRGSDERQYATMTIFAPLVIVAAQVVYSFFYGLCTTTYDNRWIGAFLSVAYAIYYRLHVLLIGYAYIALGHVTLWLSRRFGFVH